MTESNFNLYDFNKLLKEYDLGRTYLFSIEIDNDFPFDITHLSAYCRSINFTNKGKTVELEFFLIKELWDAFENLKINSTLTINSLNRQCTPIFSRKFLLPSDCTHKSLELNKFGHIGIIGEQGIPTFKVYFDL